MPDSYPATLLEWNDSGRKQRKHFFYNQRLESENLCWLGADRDHFSSRWSEEVGEFDHEVMWPFYCPSINSGKHWKCVNGKEEKTSQSMQTSALQICIFPDSLFWVQQNIISGLRGTFWFCCFSFSSPHSQLYKYLMQFQWIVAQHRSIPFPVLTISQSVYSFKATLWTIPYKLI